MPEGLTSRDENSATLQSHRSGDTLHEQTQVTFENVPLNPPPKVRNWEIRREQVHIVKMIGEGAFSQVAKATAVNITGIEGQTTVAIKMLKSTLFTYIV